MALGFVSVLAFDSSTSIPGAISFQPSPTGFAVGLTRIELVTSSLSEIEASLLGTADSSSARGSITLGVVNDSEWKEPLA